jgi:adenosine kinase
LRFKVFKLNFIYLVGGFLAQLVKNESLEKAVDCGIWSSGLIIQRSGCTFPDEMNYQ